MIPVLILLGRKLQPFYFQNTQIKTYAVGHNKQRKKKTNNSHIG